MQQKQIMQDKEMLTDVLTSQKMITGVYNTCANECATKQLRDEMMCILGEEHSIQADVFSEMNSRGWYPTPAADQQKINDAKTKFQGIANTL